MSALGAYLKDRRAKLDPTTLGFSTGRRRTPGLRREEVAQRANVSATWYTWLEQGRGGAPSADVLDRLARALMLSEVEREHLFLLAQGRPPEARRHPVEGVGDRLQRVLDAFDVAPAFIKTPTWDIVAWNNAATRVFVDYAALAPADRNVLRLQFCDPRARAEQMDWESVARYTVAGFRADAARSGMGPAVSALVDDLCARSPEFAALWRDHDVRATYGDRAKVICHPVAGVIRLECSGFAVDGRPDLNMVVFNPATPADAERLRTL